MDYFFIFFYTSLSVLTYSAVQYPTTPTPIPSSFCSPTSPSESPRAFISSFERALQTVSVASCAQVSSPLPHSDYTVTQGAGTSGNVDYRCWPSHSQQGCVLSVHSAREAAHICNSHSQCNSFTLTGQRTWTGQFKLSLIYSVCVCLCVFLSLHGMSFFPSLVFYL